jgi:hypothetical protein
MKPRRLPPSQMPAKAELITCLQEAEAWFVMSSADVCGQLNYRGTLSGGGASARSACTKS